MDKIKLSIDDSKAKAFLVGIAKKRETIDYERLCKEHYKELNYGQRQGQRALWDSLTRIIEFENSEDRPLLSVIVILEKGKIPGSGFFTKALKMGRYRGGETEEQQRGFYEEECENVYKYWEHKSYNIH
jgi:hypothetical protein